MSRLAPPRWTTWATLATAVALGALVAVLLDAGSPIRPVLVFVFVLFVPGIALVRLLGFRELEVIIALGCGVSIALAGAVAAALLAVGLLSASLGIAILVVLTGAALAVELALAGHREPDDERFEGVHAKAGPRERVANAVRLLVGADPRPPSPRSRS